MVMKFFLYHWPRYEVQVICNFETRTSVNNFVRHPSDMCHCCLCLGETPKGKPPGLSDCVLLRQDILSL